MKLQCSFSAILCVPVHTLANMCSSFLSEFSFIMLSFLELLLKQETDNWDCVSVTVFGQECSCCCQQHTNIL